LARFAGDLNVKKRPIAVTIVSVLFIIVGVVGMIRGVWTLVAGRGGGITGHQLIDASLVETSSLAALLSGLFMWRGANWARWLCLAWMAFHVVISMGHERMQLIVHSMWMIVLTVVLFWPSASAYFRKD
jgi:hypothetical protein